PRIANKYISAISTMMQPPILPAIVCTGCLVVGHRSEQLDIRDLPGSRSRETCYIEYMDVVTDGIDYIDLFFIWRQRNPMARGRRRPPFSRKSLDLNRIENATCADVAHLKPENATQRNKCKVLGPVDCKGPNSADAPHRADLSNHPIASRTCHH